MAWRRRSKSCRTRSSTPRFSAESACSRADVPRSTPRRRSSDRRRQPVAARRAVFLGQARNAVRALPPDVKRRVRAAIDELKADPTRGEPLGGELSSLHRARIGRYRVVYRATANALEIVAVGPRRTIYVDLERLRRAGERRPGLRSS